MDASKSLPDPIKRVQKSLKPFSQSRQEVSRVRRVLAAHLSFHVDTQTGNPLSQPLSLVDTTFGGDSLPSGVRGCRREYLRSVRANVKARKEYDTIKREHQLQDTLEHSNLHSLSLSGSHEMALESLLDLIKYRRKHERLGIFQDYIDTLAQKPAAAGNYLDSKVVLKDIEPLPKVPEEVMNPSGPQYDTEKTDLKDLVDRLEKSVLRAKLLLKKEQKFLAKIKVDHPRMSAADEQHGRLQALGMARNELINWIEFELAKAGDNPEGSLIGNSDEVTERVGKDYIERQLQLIQRQYLKYTKTRQTLISAASESREAPSIQVYDDIAQPPEKEVSSSSGSMSHVSYQYLRQLASITNEQKSTIQQKSHLNISLAKHLKEAGQGLDRLIEESHLLPTHPLASGSSHGKGSASFGDVIGSSEKPSSSRRVRAWVYASDSATLSTMEAVSERLEEGKISTLAAQVTLSDLHSLLGEREKDTNIAGQMSPREIQNQNDLWVQLDGQLGMIRPED